MDKPQVTIVGAGTGGLCLAQGLKAAGIPFHVYERDRTATDRAQGYRLTIDANGARALHSCLPRENFERYIAASARISTGVTFVDHRLRRLLAIDFPQTNQSAPEAPRPISRIALRQILLEGLADSVAFGKTFSAFEERADNRVVAHFEDGSIAEGDILVGADGASSRVRRELLPDAQRVDTGLVAVSGKFALDDAARRETPPAAFKGPTLILGPRGGFMFAGAVEYPEDSASAFDRDEYVMWGFSMRREALGITAPDEVTSDAARAAVLTQTHDWSPAIRRLVERAEPESLTAFSVKTSVPIDPWPTRRVTLLGDALHNMTPYQGIGANTALRDAVILRAALQGVASGSRDLLTSLAAYERAMIGYGFAAVRASLTQMRRLHSHSPVARFGAKAFFRLLDKVPALQRRVMRRE